MTFPLSNGIWTNLSGSERVWASLSHQAGWLGHECVQPMAWVRRDARVEPIGATQVSGSLEPTRVASLIVALVSRQSASIAILSLRIDTRANCLSHWLKHLTYLFKPMVKPLASQK